MPRIRRDESSLVLRWRCRRAPVLPGLLAVATLVGCASSASPELAARGTTTDLNFNHGRSASTTSDGAFAAPTTIDAPVEQVWRALLKALPAVGVPIEAVSQPTWTAGTQATKVRRRFGGQPLSASLTCGGSAGVADVADSHIVTLSVLSTLQPDSAGTQLQTRVVAAANDPFTSVPARHCISRGRIEARVDSAVRALMPGP